MKKLLSAALILALLLALGVPAFAEEAKYENTKAFLNLVKDVEGLETELLGVIPFAGENYERVRVTYKSDDYTSHFSVLFHEDEEDVVLYMNPLIKFDENKLDELVAELNSINARTTGLKLYADTSDNSVSAELYLLVTKDSAAELAATGVGLMVGFTDSVYESLSKFAAK